MIILEIIATIYVGLSAVYGFGFAWFFAFFALDDTSISGWVLLMYIIAFVVLEIPFSLAAMILLPGAIWERFMKLL